MKVSNEELVAMVRAWSDEEVVGFAIDNGIASPGTEANEASVKNLRAMILYLISASGK